MSAWKESNPWIRLRKSTKLEHYCLVQANLNSKIAEGYLFWLNQCLLLQSTMFGFESTLTNIINLNRFGNYKLSTNIQTSICPANYHPLRMIKSSVPICEIQCPELVLSSLFEPFSNPYTKVLGALSRALICSSSHIPTQAHGHRFREREYTVCFICLYI